MRYSFSMTLSVFALLVSSQGYPEVTLSKVKNNVLECPAFDIVQRRIVEVVRGAGGQEIKQDNPEPVAVEIVFDFSGSMAARIDGQRKVDIARTALRQVLTQLDKGNAVVGIRAYGFDGSVEKTPSASCSNTVLVSDFSAKRSSTHLRRIAALEPFGYTPIASSLAAASNDLMQLKSRDRMIVLISDGEETCGGDPVSTAKFARESGVAVATYVIGFDLNPDQQEQMQYISEAGGGAYFDARDALSLSTALEDAVGVTMRKTRREIEKCINPKFGGKEIETAVLTAPGLYTLGETLEKGEQRYYKIESSVGQLITIHGLLQSRRTIMTQQGLESEARHSIGPITLFGYRQDGKPINDRLARARDLPGTSITIKYMDTLGGGMILGVGDNYDRTASDALFAIEVSDAFDATLQSDSSEINPVDLLVDTEIVGHLGYEDIRDVYRVNLTRISTNGFNGDALAIVKFRPELEDFRSRVWLEYETEGTRRRIPAKLTENTISVPHMDNVPDAVWINIESREMKQKSRFSAYTLSFQIGNSMN